MDENKENYKSAHKYLQQNASTLPLKDLEISRNTLFHSYLASVDSKTCLFNYDDDLCKYNALMNKNSNVIDKKISAILSKTPNKKCVINSGLSKETFNKYMPKMPCSEGKAICSKSENISNADFQEFLASFNKSLIKTASSKPNLHGNNAGNKVTRDFTSRNMSEKRFNPPTEKKKYTPGFITAAEDYKMNQGNQNTKRLGMTNNTGCKRKVLGSGPSGGIRKPFISPLLSNSDNNPEDVLPKSQEETDERYKNIDPKMIELITNEIMDVGPQTTWDDIAGLEFAKTAIKEAVVWPMLRPDIFTGLRRPPKGILLFGPPGTGKTLIGKCVASQSKSTFFSISASSLTSKWIGDGEKMVRALFAVARVHQPSVIFIDEVDSLLSQRSDNEHESSRRLKTEFLVQLDGATTDNEDRILLIGATNRPQELDEAARRRFVKRLYIPLPEYEARFQLVKKLMATADSSLTESDFEEISNLSDGYSGADMRNLCAEASLGPIRSIDISKMQSIEASEVRPINMDDFKNAFKRIRSSVAANDLQQYILWDSTYGSGL